MNTARRIPYASVGGNLQRARIFTGRPRRQYRQESLLQPNPQSSPHPRSSIFDMMTAHPQPALHTAVSPPWKLVSVGAGRPHRDRIRDAAPSGRENRGTAFASERCGQDAYFHRWNAIGVADGVGGWADVPYADPGLYAQLLLSELAQEVARVSGDNWEDGATTDGELYNRPEDPSPDLKILLERAYERMPSTLLGSTTACFALLHQRTLRVANLGDCTLLVIRRATGQLALRTAEMQHDFNYPYQLGTGSQVQPHDAHVYKVQVERGDVVVLASDGLFDNVAVEEVVELVQKECPPIPPATSSVHPEEEQQRLRNALHQLLERALDVRSDPRARTPFGDRAAAKDGGMYASASVGGKMDDVSIVIASVLEEEDSPDRR